jgi:CRISPR/Cas system CMR subunit Cmr4 (Cas7 group RAMP superfamily)
MDKKLFTGYIYIVINLKNSKKYVGQTTRTIKYRIYEHIRCSEIGIKTKFYNAIRKYGFDISKANKGKIVSEETKQKLKEFNLGKKQSKKTKEKCKQCSSELWKDDNFKQKQKNGMNAWKNSENFQQMVEKNRIRQIENQKSEEYKKKHKESVQKWWNERRLKVKIDTNKEVGG